MSTTTDQRRAIVATLKTTGQVASLLGIDRRTVLQRARTLGVGHTLDTVTLFLPEEVAALRDHDWTPGRKPKRSQDDGH